MAYDEAAKNRTINYLKKLKEVRFRVKPEEYERYERAAASAGYDSMRRFYMDAIDEKIERLEKE